MRTKQRNVAEKTSAISIGVLSLITVFTVILLVSLALLTYQGVLNNQNLTEKVSESVSEFYMADSKANEQLAQLYNIYLENETETFVEKVIEFGYEIEEVDNQRNVVRYKVEMNARESLLVEIAFEINRNEIEVLTWKTMVE